MGSFKLRAALNELWGYFRRIMGYFKWVVIHMNCGLQTMNSRLLQGMVAHCFELLGFPGRPVGF